MEDFQKKCRQLGIILTEEQISKFAAYYELLIEWNSFMNLTAITDFNDVVIKHFVDSLAVYQAPEFKKFLEDSSMSEHMEQEEKTNRNINMIDVGTGAGFPGIPLKIVFPEIQVVLLDSLQKRIRFLDTVIEKLELNGIDTIHGRAEDYAGQSEHREKYDLCISRAVANLSTLSELCIPFVKKDGYFISYKSEKVKEELSEAEKAISLLGGKVEKQYEYLLPETDIKRNLLLIKKVRFSPKKYPRKVGTPAKTPIK